jgi:hypothetical protein
MQGVKFYSIYLTEESPVGRENLICKRKGPKLDVYGLNWILLKVYLNL